LSIRWNKCVKTFIHSYVYKSFFLTHHKQQELCQGLKERKLMQSKTRFS